MIDSMRSNRSGMRRVGAVVGAVLLALTLLAFVVGSRGGGSGSGSDESMSGGSAGSMSADMATEGGERVDGPVAADSEALASTAEESVSGGTPMGQVPLEDRAVIRTGSLSLVSENVAAARRQVLAAMNGLGGYVENEQSRADDDGGLRQTELALKVPSDEFDSAMAGFADAGTVVARTQSARDVTEQVVDVDTRVASAQASLRRIRLLLADAVSLGDVIRLEQVLSSRQADLESLLSQQESLAAKTDMATVNVLIEVPAERFVDDEPAEATGFFAGLSRGWDALAAGYVTLSTALGTALPTLIALGLLALVTRLLVRRFRRPATPPRAAAA